MRHNRASAGAWLHARRREAAALQSQIQTLDHLAGELADDPRSNAVFIRTLRDLRASASRLRRAAEQMVRTCERDGLDLAHDPDA